MSYIIRSCISFAKNTLVHKITVAQNHINARPVPNAPQMEWISWIQLISTTQRQIDGAVNRIEIQIQRWTNLMQNLDVDKIAKEQILFNKNANGNEGLLAAIKKGQKMSALLNSTMQIGQEFIHQLNANQKQFNWNSKMARNSLAKIIRLNEKVNNICSKGNGHEENFRKNSDNKADDPKETCLYVSAENKKPENSATKIQQFDQLRKIFCVNCNTDDHHTSQCGKCPTGNYQQKQLAIPKISISCRKDNEEKECANNCPNIEVKINSSKQNHKQEAVNYNSMTSSPEPKVENIFIGHPQNFNCQIIIPLGTLDKTSRLIETQCESDEKFSKKESNFLQILPIRGEKFHSFDKIEDIHPNSHDPQILMQNYEKIIKDQQIDGIIKMDENQKLMMDPSEQSRWHPSKIKMFYRGQVLRQKFAAVQLHWRKNKNLATCNSASAYNMPEHPFLCNAIQLHWQNLEQFSTPENSSIRQNCRLLFGTMPSPFILCETIVHNSGIAHWHPKITFQMEKSNLDNNINFARDDDNPKTKIKFPPDKYMDAGTNQHLANKQGHSTNISPEEKSVPELKMFDYAKYTTNTNKMSQSFAKSGIAPSEDAARKISTKPLVEKAFTSKSEKIWPTNIFIQPQNNGKLEKIAITEKQANASTEMPDLDPEKDCDWDKFISSIMFVLKILRKLNAIRPKVRHSKMFNKFSFTGKNLASTFNLATKCDNSTPQAGGWLTPTNFKICQQLWHPHLATTPPLRIWPNYKRRKKKETQISAHPELDPTGQHEWNNGTNPRNWKKCFFCRPECGGCRQQI